MTPSSLVTWRGIAERKQYDTAMWRRRSRTTGLVVLGTFAVLATGCASGASGDTARDFSCDDLDKQSDVELVVCDDGETRIDRRSDQAPATPEAERVE